MCLSYLKVLTPTQMIEFMKTIEDFRMVRWSFWRDSRLGLLCSFVSMGPFSVRDFLPLSHVDGSLVSHVNLVFNLLAISSEWFAFQQSLKIMDSISRTPGYFFFFSNGKNTALDTFIKLFYPLSPLETNYKYFIIKLGIPNVWIYGAWASQETLLQFNIVEL